MPKIMEAQETCINCGIVLYSDGRFCHACGVENRPICSNCEHKIRPGANFCDNCGTKYESPVAAAIGELAKAQGELEKSKKEIQEIQSENKRLSREVTRLKNHLEKYEPTGVEFGMNEEEEAVLHLLLQNMDKHRKFYAKQVRKHFSNLSTPRLQEIFEQLMRKTDFFFRSCLLCCGC